MMLCLKKLLCFNGDNGDGTFRTTKWSVESECTNSASSSSLERMSGKIACHPWKNGEQQWDILNKCPLLSGLQNYSTWPKKNHREIIWNNEYIMAARNIEILM